MHGMRYWLLLGVAQAPKAFAWAIGILVALLLMAAALVATVLRDESRAEQQHAEALRIFREISTESSRLFARIAERDELDCSHESLADLNTLLLESRYLREVGVLDADRRLVCSTALGRLPEPVKGNYPVYVSRSGLELLNRVPLAMAGKRLTGTIIQRPPVNVVVSPYATEDMNARADAIWLRTDAGLVLLDADVAADALPGMKERAERLQASELSHRGPGYELVSMAPDLDIVLQTRRSLPTILRDGGALLAMLLAGSVLVALLVMGSITPYIRRLRGLRNRIAFLCDEAHLALVYQPVFDLETRRPIGCEVLARLEEGDRLWPPHVMIPAILDAGLEQRFDHAVARKAIAELAARLPAQAGSFKVALNCFPRSIAAESLAPVLASALEKAGRTDIAVCVEITEHSISSELIAEVRKLKGEGFLVAVDDFGTGYSNLKSVTQLAPDLLKIDGSFVYELEAATVRSSLIPEIVNIAHAVGAAAVAEGIESPDQVALLLAAGVRYGQGYALARPMGIEALLGFMAQVSGYLKL